MAREQQRESQQIPQDATPSRLPSGSLPLGPGWRLIADRAATRRDVVLIWVVLAVLVGPVSIGMGIIAVDLWVESPAFGSRSDLPLLMAVLRFLIPVVGCVLIPLLTVMLHEFSHGLAAMAFGLRPRYGVKMMKRILPVAYCTYSGPLRRNQHLLVVAAPTVTVTGVLLLASALIRLLGPYLLFAAAANLLGAVGDWWAIARLLREDRSAFILDHPTELGYLVVAPEDNAVSGP